MAPISVMLVDDSPLFLSTATQFLGMCKEVAVVGSCSSGQEALEKARELRPQVILLDIMMPGMSGLSVIGPLKQLLPDATIIALTMMDTPDFRKAALAAGADAFIPKSAMHVSLLPAIRKIGGGDDRKDKHQAAAVAPDNNEAAVPRTILLMEDDPSQRHLYARALRRAGYLVYEAGTLQEARDLLARNHFDMFLCDVHIGHERGTDLLREQSEVLRKNSTQVVIVSADPGYRCIAEAMGVEFYLEKPVSVAALVTLVDRLTMGHHSRRLSAERISLQTVPKAGSLS